MKNTVYKGKERKCLEVTKAMKILFVKADTCVHMPVCIVHLRENSLT